MLTNKIVNNFNFKITTLTLVKKNPLLIEKKSSINLMKNIIRKKKSEANDTPKLKWQHISRLKSIKRKICICGEGEMIKNYKL